MADLSDAELKTEIETILKDADLAVWTTKKVTQKLESQYGAGIRKKKATIIKMVHDYVDSMEDKEDEEDEESEESEKEEKKPTKRAAKSRAKSEEKDDESDVSSDDEKPKTKRGRRAAPKPRVTKEKTPKAKKATGKKGGGTGFTRSYKLSPALSALMGADEMPRHAVVKRIWAIVKENNLFDPNNRQFAICDDALHKVIGKQRFKVFGMMKYLKGHFLD